MAFSFVTFMMEYSMKLQNSFLFYATQDTFDIADPRGVARIFQRGGGGGHTVSNNMVMAFSPRNIVGCLL